MLTQFARNPAPVGGLASGETTRAASDDRFARLNLTAPAIASATDHSPAAADANDWFATKARASAETT